MDTYMSLWCNWIFNLPRPNKVQQKIKIYNIFKQWISVYKADRGTHWMVVLHKVVGTVLLLSCISWLFQASASGKEQDTLLLASYRPAHHLCPLVSLQLVCWPVNWKCTFAVCATTACSFPVAQHGSLVALWKSLTSFLLWRLAFLTLHSMTEAWLAKKTAACCDSLTHINKSLLNFELWRIGIFGKATGNNTDWQTNQCTMNCSCLV